MEIKQSPPLHSRASALVEELDEIITEFRCARPDVINWRYVDLDINNSLVTARRCIEGVAEKMEEEAI